MSSVDAQAADLSDHDQAERTPAGIADAIPSLDNEQAAWTHSGARILAAHGFDVTVTSASPNDADWYLGDFIAFRPPLEQRAPLGAPAEELMHALSTHEGSLEEIENLTGLAAEFSGHGAPPMGWAVVELSRGGEPLGSVAFLAAPPMARKPAAQVPLAPAFVVARLPMRDAEQLTGGDMVVLEQGPWALITQPGSITLASVGFDPVSGRLGPTFAASSHSHAPPQQEPASMNNSDDMGMLSVPVALHLPDILVSPVELARLADGGTLELGPIAEGLQVALAVGGRTVGHGEVVRLGDRFAVLMDAPAEADPASHRATDDTDDISVDAFTSDISETQSEAANPDIITAEELGSR